MSPALQVDSLPAEPQRKPKNPGVGTLSLLPGIFPTQGSNRGLLRCRRIFHQLSYQGSPLEDRALERFRNRGGTESFWGGDGNTEEKAQASWGKAESVRKMPPHSPHRFFSFLASPCNLWDPSFLTTIAPWPAAMRAQSLNHWTARGFPASGNLKGRLLDTNS